MNVRPEVKEVVRWFVRRGDRHLDAAVILARADGNNVADAACYHCIEATDKYLKALLTLNDIAAPRTHDLNYIHNLLPEVSRLHIDSSDLIYLSTYGIERWWDPDQAQAVRALEITRHVREQTGKALSAISILS
jgi:HEPN domain-containing protein